MRRAAQAGGVADRLTFAGVLTGTALDAAYAASDLLVAPTRLESYGMVVAEALARGLPVIASAVGGVAEALGRASDGSAPGVLVPAGDGRALSAALTGWLTRPELRAELRAGASARRAGLTGWDLTARTVSAALDRVARE